MMLEPDSEISVGPARQGGDRFDERRIVSGRTG